ncbi:hypothetical protein [uncultured Selenomonas sp.]|uniref:hypothetical protein n=1 Tax=uncultured Selenomonas sp. TaxID=159275 RepID=UPI0028DB97C2|nr:hypothetical protein [uncultured Selenomonas sp.]
MIPPHKTPSAELLAKIRRYIAEHLRDTSDVIEEAKRKLPHPKPRPFERERGQYGVRREVHKESKGLGKSLPRMEVGLDGILSRLKSKLDKPSETFSKRLLRLIDASGMTDVEAYKRAGIDRKLFSKIRTDRNYHPKIRLVYAFIFVLGLNLDDARDLLASAGYSISPASEFDLVMQYCIEEGFDIDTVNEVLYALGMDVL